MLTRRDLHKLAGLGAMASVLPIGRRARGQERPTLTIAVDNLWPTLATISGIATTTRRIFPNFYDKLIERDYISDPNGLTLQPKLATSWERSGTVWSLQIREGVRFHNGAELTAEDVAFTLGADRLWGPKPFEPRGKTFTAGFKRVEATGRHTVEIETESEDPNIPGKLTGYIGFVVPKAYYLERGVDGFGQAPIGTGPYKVNTFRSGEILVLDANDDYWEGPPPAQQLRWQIVPEFSARMAGLVSGEFDFIVNIPTDQEPTLEGYDGVLLTRRQIDNYPSFAFNCLPDPEDNPLVDPKLRYAMVQGVDMDTIVQALFGDATAHPSVPFNFPEYGRYYDPTLTPRLPFDPERAQALVQETAYDGQPLRWHITRQFYPNYEAAAEIMVEQWREIGINVEAIVLDSFELVYQRPYHLMNMSMSSDFIPGDPYQPIWLDWGPTATRSTASWKSWTPTERFLEIGRRFERAVDFEERRQAFIELSSEWQDVTPGFYLWKSVYNWAHSDAYEWRTAGQGEMRMYGDYLKVL